MPYIINKTDGTILTTLIDGTTDDTTDLTLIGKNYTGFGEQVNENFVRLLENFSGVSEPEKPLVGQLWFDTAEGRLKVYSSTGWRPAGGPIVTSLQPLNFASGDLWIDNNENQLWFFDGSDLILAGPIWKRTQGKTGFVAETLYDANNNAKPCLFQYVANSLIGIWSSNEFVPVPVLPGFERIYKGYTANSEVVTVLNTTVSNAQKLGGIDSNGFMKSTGTAYNSEKIFIQNDQGLTIGQNQIADIKVVNGTLTIENVLFNADISIRSNQTDAIYVDGQLARVGIFTPTPQETLDVNGNVRIRGDLVVERDSVVLEVSQLRVEDINIELGYTDASVADDLVIDGAGIIVKGTSDKTILFKKNQPTYDSATSPSTINYSTFNISENLNLADGKFFSVGGKRVLDGNTLSSWITSAPGITSIGPQVAFTVDNLYLNNNRISSTEVNQDIEVEPNGDGNVSLIGSPRIVGMQDPVDDQDATTKLWTEIYVKSQPITMTLVQNGLEGSLNTNIIDILNNIAPPILFVDGKKAYILLEDLDNSVTPLVVTRSYKTFHILNGAWAFLS